MITGPARTWKFLSEWPTRSQHGSCRNALVASTTLAERRREREEVEEFLARHAARSADGETLGVAVRPA